MNLENGNVWLAVAVILVALLVLIAEDASR